MSFCWWGVNTEAQYSRWWCRRAVYALILASSWQPYIVLLGKFNTRAFDVASKVWSSQVSLLLIFKPRYLNDSTHTGSLLLMLYLKVGVFLLCEIHITLHLLVFNDNCHLSLCIFFPVAACLFAMPDTSSPNNPQPTSVGNTPAPGKDSQIYGILLHTWVTRLLVLVHVFRHVWVYVIV